MGIFRVEVGQPVTARSLYTTLLITDARAILAAFKYEKRSTEYAAKI